MALVVREPGTCATVCQSISSTAQNIGQWLGKTVQSGVSAVASFASKTAAFARLHFKNPIGLIRNNKGPIAFVAVGAAFGALFYAGISALFCSKTTSNRE